MVTVNMHICFFTECSALSDHLFVSLFLFSVAVYFSLLACLFAYLSVYLFACQVSCRLTYNSLLSGLPK